jgi:hypothetical protein
MSAHRQLSEVLAEIWMRLSSSADRAGAGWWLPVLSTVTTQGEPAARTIVLRQCDPQQCLLRAYTDRRSPKVQELQHSPSAAWTFYDAVDRIQLTAKTQVRVLTSGPTVDACWRGCRPDSLRAYLQTVPPGTPLTSEPHTTTGQTTYTREQLEAGREWFVVLEAEITQLDWLALLPEGNQRAVFRWEHEAWQGEWVTP